MRILISVSFAFPGTTGSPLLVMDVAAELHRRGHDVAVLRYAGRRAASESMAWRDIPVHHISARDLAPFLWRYCREGIPDVAYVHESLGHQVLLPLALARVPFVHEVHSLSERPPPPGGRIPRLVTLQRNLGGVFEEVSTTSRIVLSNRVAAEIEGMRKPRRIPTTVAYPPIDPRPFSWPSRGVTDDGPIVLYSGNFARRYQGLEILASAIPVVREQRPDVRFMVVGGEREELRWIPADLLSQIEVLGRVPAESIPPMLENADILVIPRPDVPSNSTTARKLGELLLAGRTVVATDVADHRELLEGNSAGLVTSPTSASFAEGLLQALSPDTDTSSMAAAARLVGLRHFALGPAVDRREQALLAACGAR